MMKKLHLTQSLAILAMAVFMLMPGKGWGQTQLAAWTFDATAAAPNTPSSVTANLGAQSGTATLYANGTNGSSTWITATSGNELTAFGGTTVNDPRVPTVAGNAYSPIGGTGLSANGKCMILKLSMTGFQDPILTYATRNTSTGFSTQTWAWSTDNITYTNISTITGLTTTFALKTLDMSSINSLDQASTVYLRITFTGATNATGNNRLDNFVINATAASAGGPSKLAITSINGGTSPSVGTPFNVVVQSQDASGTAALVTAATAFTLSLATGTGTLGGTVTGSIAAGENTATVTGVTYNITEAGVSLTATRNSGDLLTAGTSSPFMVLTAADHLAFANFPSIGFPTQAIPTFTVEARRADNTVDMNFPSATVTLAQASGPGTVTGTLTKSTSLGVATFNDIVMSINGSYSVTASCAGLTGATSGSVSIVDPVYRSKASGSWNASASWEVYNGTTWVAATDYPNAANKSVTILNSHVINVSDNNGKCSDLTIDAGGKVWKNSPTSASYLYVYGNILNNGTIGSSDGGITASALGFDIEGANCLISGSGTFDAWRMAKFTTTNAVTSLTIAQDVTLRYNVPTAYTIYNSASATSLNIIINPGKTLAATFGSIDMTNVSLTISSGATLLDNGNIANQTGTNVTVERTISGNGSDWHLVSAPISDATANVFYGMYLQSFTPTPAAPYTTAPYGYTDITDPLAGLNVMEGYGLYSTLGASNTVSFTGTLNTGSKSHALSLNGNNPNGWNLLGNPYPSSIDWETVTFPLGMSAEVHYIDAATGADLTYVQGIGGTGSQYIPAMQGFFVSTTTAGTFEVSNANRSAQGSGTYYKSSNSNLLVLEATGNGFSDQAWLQFNELAGLEHDGVYDAYKRVSTSNLNLPQIFSYTPGGVKLAINGMPNTSEVPVGFTAGQAGVFTFNAIKTGDLSIVSLEDTKTGIFTNLLTGSYSFSFVPGDNENRFVLHFGTLSVNETKIADANIYSFQKTVFVNMKGQTKGDIYIYNIAGQLVASKAAAQGMNEIGLSVTGNYVVKVVTRDSSVVRKVFVN